MNGENPNGSWLGWASVGAGASPGPAVAMSAVVSDFGINEFALNRCWPALFDLWDQLRTGTHGSAWAALRAGVNARVTFRCLNPATAPFAFAVGTDGNVYWNDQPSWATWSTWASLGAPA